MAEMTDPDPTYLTAARAWCLAKFPYDHADQAAREQHLAYDAASTADEPWLRALVDAVRAACLSHVEVLDVRPGDKLLARVGRGTSRAEADRIRDGLVGALPGVEVVVVSGVDQFAVCRPEAPRPPVRDKSWLQTTADEPQRGFWANLFGRHQ